MQSRKFKYLPHTSDIKFVAYGRDFREALENASLAMLNVMLDIGKIKKFKKQERRLQINERADTKENLVWYALQDILTKVDEKSLCAFGFEADSLKRLGKNLRLNGSLRYKMSVPECFLTEIKAVTPYGLEIKESAGRCEISVVVDV